MLIQQAKGAGTIAAYCSGERSDIVKLYIYIYWVFLFLFFVNTDKVAKFQLIHFIISPKLLYDCHDRV